MKSRHAYGSRQMEDVNYILLAPKQFLRKFSKCKKKQENLKSEKNGHSQKRIYIYVCIALNITTKYIYIISIKLKKW